MVLIRMPVFNEVVNIKRAIDSVLSQTYTNFLLLISDNHSTDGTLEKINEVAKNDSRVIIVSPPTHLTSLEHGKYIQENFMDPNNGIKYSIFIGGHDYWDVNYLKTLVERAEKEFNPSIVYGNSCEVDNLGKIVRRYRNVLQSTDILKPFIPIHFLLGLSHNNIYGGLWSEKHRKKIRIKHHCSAIDHFEIVEMALIGDIVYEQGAFMYLGQSVQVNDGWKGYIKKHLNNEIQNKPLVDFANQLDWVSSLIDRTINFPPVNGNDMLKNVLKSAFLSAYVARYYNILSGFDNGLLQFFQNKDIKNIIALQQKSSIYFDEFINNNKLI